MTFLDTSVVIDFLAGDEKVISTIKGLTKRDSLKTTTITEYELLKHGDVLKREVAEKFLSAVTVCPFERAAAKQAALLYERLRAKGTMVNENDLLIAGVVLACGDVLLTRDKGFAYLAEANIKII
jgi:tRNA(fMet)-specific endonuclease VapC